MYSVYKNLQNEVQEIRLKLSINQKGTLKTLSMGRVELGVELPQGCRATTRRQFTINHQVPRNTGYKFAQSSKDEGLTRHWSYLEVKRLDSESKMDLFGMNS